MIFIAPLNGNNYYCIPQVWEWKTLRTRCQFSMRLWAFFRRTITVWWQTGKILAVFFQFVSVYICLGVIVRLQFQFSPKRGECDCSSRGGGHWGLPSKQSGKFQLPIFRETLWRNVWIMLKWYYLKWTNQFSVSLSVNKSGFPWVLPESLSEQRHMWGGWSRIYLHLHARVHRYSHHPKNQSYMLFIKSNFECCLTVVCYSGAKCEVDIDECDSAPCQNGGLCKDGMGEFQCQCKPGFLGD